MKSVTKKQKILIGIIITFIFIASMSFTYAYFSVGMAQQNPNAEVVTTGTLQINFQDGPELKLDRAFPGDYVYKEIKIENTGSLDAEYNLKWKYLTNEIINDELFLSVLCSEYTTYNGFDIDNMEDAEGNIFIGECGEINEPIGTSTLPSLISQRNIESGHIQVYHIGIVFMETEEEQNYNQGKLFSAQLEVIPGREEIELDGQIVDSNNNPISNATIEFHSDVISTTTDENGRYHINGLVSGEHNIIVKNSSNETIANDTFTIEPSKDAKVSGRNNIKYMSGETFHTLKTTIGNNEQISNYEWVLEYTDESCFVFNNGTITDYDLECPKKLVIPPTIDGAEVYSIGEDAFNGNGIKYVYIPEGIFTIDEKAFYDNDLIAVTIPTTVRNIYYRAFYNNPLLKKVNIKGKSSVNAFNVYDDIWYPESRLSCVINNRNNMVPNGCINWGNGIAFEGKLLDENNNITSATKILVDGTEIFYSAEEGYYEKGYFGETILSDGTHEIIIKNNNDEIIAQDTFELRKSNVSEVISGNIIKYIPEIVYKNIVAKINSDGTIDFSLESIQIDESCFTFDNGTITDYDAIECGTYVTIPSTINNIPVTTIGAGAFSHFYTNYTSFGGNNLFDKYSNLFAQNDKRDVSNVAGYSWYIRSVYIPNTVTTIECDAFYDNELSNIIIPDSVTTIGGSAFANNKLMDATIPNSVVSIGREAFRNNYLYNVDYLNHLSGNENISESAFYVNLGCKQGGNIQNYCIDLK